MKIIASILLLGAAALCANPADNYVNFIRQIQKDTGVEWDVGVAASGSALSPEGVTIGGAFFELWSLHNMTAEEHLLDEQFVSAFLPGSAIQIQTGDPYEPIPRTRVDQSFRVLVDVQGLLKNTGSVTSLLNQVKDATGDTPPEELALDPSELKDWEELQAAAAKAEQERLEAEEDIEEAKQKKKDRMALAESDYYEAVAKADADYAEDLAKLESDYAARFATVEADFAEDTGKAQAYYDKEMGDLDAWLANELAKADAESDPVKAQERRDQKTAEYNEDVAKVLGTYNGKMASAQKNYQEDMDKYQAELIQKKGDLKEDYQKAIVSAQEDYLEDTTKIDEDLTNKIEKGQKKIHGVEIGFGDKYGDDAVALGAGDPDRVMEQDASKVFFTHEVHTYPHQVYSVDGFRIAGTPIMEAYLNRNGIEVFEFDTPNIKAADLLNAAGEEIFSIMTLAGYEISGTVLDSKKVQIWPVAKGELWGYDPLEVYDDFPSLKVDLYNLYPASKTFVRVYPGIPTPTPDPTAVLQVEESVIILDDSIPQNRGLVMDVNNYMPKEGLHTIEILHETPFGTDLLAQSTARVDRTISIKGSIYSKE